VENVELIWPQLSIAYGSMHTTTQRLVSMLPTLYRFFGPQTARIVLCALVLISSPVIAFQLGGEHDVFVATHQACKAFRVDLAQKGYHTYNIKGANQFNIYIKNIFEEASGGQQSQTLSNLLRHHSFNSALEVCYPRNQNNKDLFIKNMTRVQDGGTIQRQAVDIALFAVGVIPMVKIVQFLKTAHSTGLIIYNTMEAAVLSFALGPVVKDLSERGYKIFISRFVDPKEGATQNIVTVPAIEENSYFDYSAMRQENLAMLLESKKIIQEKLSAIKSPNDNRLSALTAQLASVDHQINELRNEIIQNRRNYETTNQ